MSKKFLRLSVLLLCIMPSVNAFASSFDNLFVFGDSLSDTGNDFALTGGTLPGSPYYQGRFTNGLNYIDDLSTKLGLSLTPAKFFPPPPNAGGNNYAYGGARTNSHPSGAPISVQNQVTAFLTGLGTNNADSNALYVLWAGANNIQDAISSTSSSTCDPVNCQPAMEAAVTSIGNMLSQLASKGAKEFLVPNIPNLGLVPSYYGNPFAASATEFFDQQLDIMLNGLGSLDIKRFDVDSLVQQVVANPGAFGFINVTDPCYIGSLQGGGTVCTNPDDYLFWDGIHPTAHGHALLAEYAYQVLVPAPSSVALLLLGLGVLVANRGNFKQSKIRLA